MIESILAYLMVLGDQYPWLGPASAIVTIGAAATGLLRWSVAKSHRIRREAEEKVERLEVDIVAFKEEIANLKGEANKLEGRLPESAWKLAERERQDGNEEHAIGALRRHMDTEGARLSEMARQIANFHLGRVIGQDRGRDHDLIPAERFSLLAFHLDPRNGEAGELLREIQQVRGGRPFEHVQFTDDFSMPEDDPAGYHALPQTAEAVDSLLDDADKAITRGRYLHALALADTAFVAARRWSLGEREPLALSGRYHRAWALHHLGRHMEALGEIDGAQQHEGILQLREQSPDLGPEHPYTLSTRHLRAAILDRLGRHVEALGEIDGTEQRKGILQLREQGPDAGPEDVDTLSTRHLRAQILDHLGRYAEALSEIDGTQQRAGILQPHRQDPDLGPEHGYILTTRYLRAHILDNLGRHAEALGEIDGTEQREGILQLHEKSPDLGSKHPHTLTARGLRAHILDNLGRHAEALGEIDGTEQREGILQLREQSPNVGPEHPNTLACRSLRGAVLHALGRDRESERELRAVGTVQERVLGPAHAATLKSGHRLATTLVALSRLGEAEEVLNAVAAGRQAALGEEHPDTQTAIAELKVLRERRGGAAG